jgi:radical SAM protein with 4Fe4S-binding SPASM domain
MCYQIDKSFSSKSKGFAGHMSLELFKKIIDQLVGNVEAVTLASRGEPTLNPKFSQMIDYANDKFLALKLNTNASMLNEKLIHRLLSSNIQTIVFSIDSKDKESYEAIRVNGKFDNIIKKLELFNKIREKNYKREDKIVRISGVKINDKQDINEMKKKWGDIADIVAFTNYVPWESSYENEINNIIEPCTEFWSRMFIWHDGKVNPCDFDYKSKLSKWNVKEDSIKNIWNSDEYNHLRYCHLNNLRSELEPCRRCINI